MRDYRLLIVLIVASIFAGCSTVDPNEPFELASIAALTQQSSGIGGGSGGGCGGGIGKIRGDALRDTAISVGAQGGLAWRAEQINCMLKAQANSLDKIYNFRMLMLKNHITPPVLLEGRDELHKADCNTVRTADMIYRIVKPPCFETTAPDWRNYIWLYFEKPEPPDASLLPKTHEEASFWNCYVRKGWDQGLKQADQIFVANLQLLNRDYTGMVLYHRLYAQNMVSAPFVAKAELGVTGDAHEMRINDQVLRITATSKLNTNHSEWQTAVWNERERLRLHHEHTPKLEDINLPEPDLMLKYIDKKVPSESRIEDGHYLVK